MSVRSVVGQWGEVQADPASAVATGQQSFCSRRKPGREVGTERQNGVGRDRESETIDLIMHAHFPIHGGECKRGQRGWVATNDIPPYQAPVWRNTNEVTLSGWSPAKTVH